MPDTPPKQAVNEITSTATTTTTSTSAATNDPTRRQAIQTGAGVAATLAGLSAAGLTSTAHAQGSDILKVGLIGCGGRGTGAMVQALQADRRVRVVALGDAFMDRVQRAHNIIKGKKDIVDAGQLEMLGDNLFAGFDNYQRVIDSGADAIQIAACPFFHSHYALAALKAGQHVFCEKPGVVDVPGVRNLFECAKIAEANNLKFAAGTQRRHEPAYQDIVGKIHEGAIGEIISATLYWCNNAWHFYARDAAWKTDMDYQVRNWRPNIWLSGDLPLALHIHNIDVCNWVMQGPPEKIRVSGGRITHTDPASCGNIYDHFAGVMLYKGGVPVTATCKTTPGYSMVDEYINGAEGVARPSDWIKGTNRYKYRGPRPSGHALVQQHWISAILNDTPLNEAEEFAYSNLTCVAYREAAYTGQEVVLKDMLAKCNRTYGPKFEELTSFGPYTPAEPPRPGSHKLTY